jgi:hypothetical protein
MRFRSTAASSCLHVDGGHHVLIELKSMLNTGNVRNDRTVDELERI